VAGKLSAISVVLPGLGSFYPVNPQLKLRAIIVRRFATLTGGDCIRLISYGFQRQTASKRFSTASNRSDLGWIQVDSRLIHEKDELTHLNDESTHQNDELTHLKDDSTHEKDD
jgi:hypothetical protein